MSSRRKAIRHLVSAAVPGMTSAEVTVLNTDGVLLASGDDRRDAAPGNMLALEKNVSQDILDNVRKTLAPYLGLRNFQISVAARLNTDKKQTNETILRPEFARRTVGANREGKFKFAELQPFSASQRRAQSAAGEISPPTTARSQTKRTKKNEQLTNYEVSSKTVATVSGGYVIEGLSVAVLVNRTSLLASLGGKPAPEAIEQANNGDRAIGRTVRRLPARSAAT